MLASKPTPPIRIVIADDHPCFVDGFCACLRKHKEIKIEGRGANGEELLWLVEQLQPDIVFTDIEMPVMNGITATKQIKERFPNTKVIAFTGFSTNDYITDMMIEAKASGYLLKGAGKTEILKAIEKVSRGEIYCSDEVLEILVSLLQRTNTNPVKPFSKPSFTDLELNVLIETGKCLGPKQIAHKLDVDVRAVESAKQRLMEKTGCTNSAELTVYAIRNFLAPL